MTKTRLDVLLYNKGLADSREKAKRLILAGNVLVDKIKIDKCGALIPANCILTITQKEKYVGRGGLKLEKSLEFFNIRPPGKTALDAGASTGGFTDCLLQNGIDKVYAVDVGYGQITWKLRSDKRVIILDRTNIRYLKKSDIGENIHLVTLDLSFISLTAVLPNIYTLLSPGGEVIALVKPQFEVGKKEVEKGGIIRCSKKRADALHTVTLFSEQVGFSPQGSIESPITGAKGNIEFLLYLIKPGNSNNIKEDTNEKNRGDY